MGIDFKNQLVILDGAMGTVLQQRGLPPGGQPELLNLTQPELLDAVYREYIDAGSQIIYANTFGANGLKLRRTGHSVEEVISAAVRVACVVTASAGSRRMGPGCASTFRFTKSGTPFACVSARATRTDATFGTDGAGTIFSAPEMCAPPRAARILTE